jgi:hypothetical protein
MPTASALRTRLRRAAARGRAGRCGVRAVENAQSATADPVAERRPATGGGREAVRDVHREARLDRPHLELRLVERQDLVDVLDAAAQEISDTADAAADR